MDVDGKRLGTSCGIAGPTVFMVLYIYAAVSDPEYVFFRNYLSDLGVGVAAWAFNAAVIIAGAFTIPFVILAVRPALGGGHSAELAVALTVVAAVFLMLVGVLTEDFGQAHTVVSLGFFMSFLGALFFYSVSLHRSNALGREMTYFTIAVFGLGAVLAVMGFNPQTETVAVLAIVVWGLVMAIAIHRS
jgi:hypothetical membrane protein